MRSKLPAWVVTRLYLIRVFPVKSKKDFFGREIILSRRMSSTCMIIWTYLGIVSVITHNMFIIIVYANRVVSTMVIAVQIFKTLVLNSTPISQVNYTVNYPFKLRLQTAIRCFRKFKV